MNDNTAFVIIICSSLIIFFAFPSCDKLNNKQDPIAERIQAIENASFGMSKEAKERLISEALKGNTNSAEVILERK